jgi:hypothetical protein
MPRVASIVVAARQSARRSGCGLSTWASGLEGANAAVQSSPAKRSNASSRNLSAPRVPRFRGTLRHLFREAAGTPARTPGSVDDRLSRPLARSAIRHSGAAAPARCRSMASRWRNGRCPRPSRSSLLGTRPSTSASIRGRRWTTRTTKCRSRSPASWTRSPSSSASRACHRRRSSG